MTTYYYPKVVTGYRWNLLKRCLYEIGVEPSCIGDMEEQTYLQFENGLTEEQKSTLDNIMINDPQNPNPSWQGAEIKDLEAVLDEVRQSTGVNLMVFYVESVKDSGIYDRIKLCSKESLTDEQKAKVEAAYNNLFVGW